MNMPALNMKRFLAPASLKFQLLSRTLIILACLLLGIGVLQHIVMQHYMVQNKVKTVQSQIMSVPLHIWGRVNGLEPPLLIFPDSSVAFISPDGTFRVLSNGLEAVPLPPLPSGTYAQALRTAGSREPVYQIMNISGEKLLTVLQPVRLRGNQQGLVQVTASMEEIQAGLARQLTIFLLLSLIVVIFGCIAFIPLLGRTLAPLSQVMAAVEKINTQNLNERLPEKHSQMEIKRLSKAFNAMLERLEASFKAETEAKEQMRRFVADASHELRTPLTSIHGFLEVLLRGAKNNPQQLDEALNSMHSETSRLKKLVQDLLLLARLDRQPELQLAKTSLGQLIKEMEPQLRLLAGDRNLRLEIRSNDAAVMDADKFKQVVLNLFHNAVQHTDPVRGDITIAVQKSKNQLELLVCDNGPGIPVEHLPHIFQRFYRVDTSRTRKHGGSGLGLAITKSIVDLHKGSIHAFNLQPKGGAFSVRIPMVSGKTGD
jgi:two-component system OmpR family sensor kinase